MQKNANETAKETKNMFLQSAKELKAVTTLAACAMFAALAMILNQVASIDIGPYVRIGFSGIPNRLVDYLFGPEHLCGKCDLYAAEWKKAADELWAENPHHKQRYENYKKENLDEEAKASTEEILSGIRG